MEKVNFPENSLIYVNQAYLTIQKSKKIYYRDYYILGQIIELQTHLLTLTLTNVNKEK